MSAPVSRRAFVATIAVATVLPARAALAQPGGDREVLEAALRLEQTAVATYGAAARSGLLDRQATELSKLFGEQDQAHAEALTAALEALGASAPAPPREDSIRRLGRLRTSAGFARIAIELELEAVAAYHEAQLELQDRELLSLCARIMASEGQHLALLRSLAGKSPVPHAFERGVA